jgi:hypothetical protein
MLATKRNPLSAVDSCLDEGEVLLFLDLLKLVHWHVLLELLGLRLGRCLLLLRGLDGNLNLCKGPLELCYSRADLKQGATPSSREDPKDDKMTNDAPVRYRYFQPPHASIAAHAP